MRIVCSQFFSTRFEIELNFRLEKINADNKLQVIDVK